MNIYSIQSMSRRNIYSHKPVIKMVVDLEDLSETESKDIEGFNAKLTGLFPGLGRHCCSYGYEGGFLRRLDEGTYLGHVIEHLALELQSMAGFDVHFGKTRMAREPSVYCIVFQYSNERCGIECARAAVDIVERLAAGKDADVRGILDEIGKITEESELGPSIRSICSEAEKRGIPVVRRGYESLVQLGYGKHHRLMESSLTDSTPCISVDIAGDKHLTKHILSDNGIPVPSGDIAYTENSAVSLARDIGYPVVLKPCDANQGKGVTLNICCEEQLRAAYREAMKFSRAVIVEKFIEGRDYRVLVVGGRVSAVSERRPPSVKGDGVHTIRELVDMENSSSLRGNGHEKPLTKIRLDDIAVRVLRRKGMSPDSIPAAGETVYLRENGNLSTGGTARDCTDEIHPYNCALAVKAAGVIGLDIAGVDITAGNISAPLDYSNGAVIEVNAAPGLRMHLFPTEGKPRNVASDIMDMLFPKGKPWSVPIISITGTNGKTTVTRLIRHTMMRAGLNAGMTSTSGIYIGSECVLEGDNTGPVSAGIVLSDRRVEAAVLETARGGIIRKGLGYDLADVGVITNITEDHLGLDNINTLEDMAFVKSLVVEAVKEDGYSVLNADDRMVDYLIKRAKGKIVLFSKRCDNIPVVKHIKAGGSAVYVRDGSIWKNFGGIAERIISVDEIPITFKGILQCNIENSLAAVSALCSLNFASDVVRDGLRTFTPDIESNPGRFNLFDMGNFRILLDYGHNPAGYEAAAEFISSLEASRNIGVIGVPGDRSVSSMRRIGNICSKAFSRIYIKEDEDTRGKKPGEVADILYESVIESGARRDSVRIIRSEVKALETAILEAQPGDLIAVFYEKLKPLAELINEYRKKLEPGIAASVPAVAH